MKDCTWVETDTVWKTSCGNYFSVTMRTPTRRGMKYCCFCGGPLIEMPEATVGYFRA